MIVVRKGLAANDLGELVALMKASADKPLTYCSPGNGSLYHLIGERLNATAGVKSVHVPYSGFAQCMTDLVGGNVDFAFLPLAGPFPGAVDAGGIRAVAMLSNAPSARFPKVPVASATKGFDGFAFSISSTLCPSSSRAASASWRRIRSGSSSRSGSTPRSIWNSYWSGVSFSRSMVASAFCTHASSWVAMPA